MKDIQKIAKSVLSREFGRPSVAVLGLLSDREIRIGQINNVDQTAEVSAIDSSGESTPIGTFTKEEIWLSQQRNQKSNN